jgi:quercetin dioxygenase-like cupin family protein
MIAERLAAGLITLCNQGDRKAVRSEATETKDREPDLRGELRATGAVVIQGGKDLKRFGAKRQRHSSLAGKSRYSYNRNMRKSRVAGLLFMATAALAQHQQSVEITSEPSHHLVFQNEYVRVFNVTVAPRATTLVHKHNYDYLFVTLGDSDVVSVRPGEKPVALKLKDGEVRFTPGNFAHAAINQSDRPFHNITIELLKPSSGVGQCQVDCSHDPVGQGPSTTLLYSSDQWRASLDRVPASGRMEKPAASSPLLFVAVSDMDLSLLGGGAARTTHREVGDITWIPAGTPYVALSSGKGPAQFAILEFKPEQQKQ